MAEWPPVENFTARLWPEISGVIKLQSLFIHVNSCFDIWIFESQNMRVDPG